jgi:hypothetical protein
LIDGRFALAGRALDHYFKKLFTVLSTGDVEKSSAFRTGAGSTLLAQNYARKFAICTAVVGYPWRQITMSSLRKKIRTVAA